MAKNYDRIKVLMAYYKEFGTLSNIYQDQEYVYNGEVIKIGWIVSNLRQDKKKGLISKDTVDLLDYMDMNWDGKHLFDYYKKYIVAWFLQYKTLSNLTQYSKFQYGDQLIDMGYILTYLKGAKKKGELTKAQIDFLDLCGIVWAPNDKEVIYEGLMLYKQIYGTIAGITSNEIFVCGNKTYNVGRQLNHLRTKYNKGKMSLEDIKFFEDMGMVWSRKQHNKSMGE